jgi:hypothetical protein
MAPERYPVGTKIVLVAARYNPHLVGALGRVADEFGYRICTDGSEHIGYVIELFDWPSPTELGLWSVAHYQIRPLLPTPVIDIDVLRAEHV